MDNINNIFDDINMSHDLIKLYNSYFLNSTDMISFSNENFKQLLINYSKYLFKISILHNNIYLEHIFDKEQTKETTVNPIYEIYNNMKNVMRFKVYFLDKTQDELNKTILRFYYELQIKSVFVIFQYYFLYNKLGKKIILPSTISQPSSSFDLLLQNYKITLTKKKEEDLPKYDTEQKLYLIAETILEKNNKKVNTEIATFIEDGVNKIIQEGSNNENTYNMFILNTIIQLLTNSNQYYDIRSHDIKQDTLILKYTILYRIIIIEFNKLFYRIDETNYITNPLQTHHIKHENTIELFLNDEKSFLNDLKELLFNVLTELYKINQSTAIIDNNTYITIPQYEGICWFISFLTALTYSDRNKKLLINKYDEIKSNVLDDLDKITAKTDYTIIFNTLVYYIINNVTKDFKTYNENDMQSDCKLFDNFKKYPFLFLKKLINGMGDFCKSIVVEKIKKTEEPDTLFRSLSKRLFNSKLPEYENEMAEFYKRKLRENPLNPRNYIYESILKKSYGMTQKYYSIIEMFYSFLNIRCMYIYKIEDKYFKLKGDFEIDYEIDYDIIIIDNQFNNMYRDIIDHIEDITVQIVNQKDSIIYNKNTYELDYLLHGTDKNKTLDNVGHCISAIHYNDEEYYYNSRNVLNTITCKKDEYIYIPCSLIKEKWKNKIDTNTCYRLDKCTYNMEYKDKIIN
jgi:hypothetical protein